MSGNLMVHEWRKTFVEIVVVRGSRGGRSLGVLEGLGEIHFLLKALHYHLAKHPGGGALLECMWSIL
jgi:hypothetical protein